jgi:hypothetical protein
MKGGSPVFGFASTSFQSTSFVFNNLAASDFGSNAMSWFVHTTRTMDRPALSQGCCALGASERVCPRGRSLGLRGKTAPPLVLNNRPRRSRARPRRPRHPGKSRHVAQAKLSPCRSARPCSPAATRTRSPKTPWSCQLPVSRNRQKHWPILQFILHWRHEKR